MARAMSASLASARMKSLQPCGSAWMRASLVSRSFGCIRRSFPTSGIALTLGAARGSIRDPQLPLYLFERDPLFRLGPGIQKRHELFIAPGRGNLLVKIV